MSLAADQSLTQHSLPSPLFSTLLPPMGQFDFTPGANLMDSGAFSWLTANLGALEGQSSSLGLAEWAIRERLGLVSDKLPPTLDQRRGGNMTERVPVASSEHVAEIVGRQGCKIKALRSKTNTYIKTPSRGEEPVFVVTGRMEDVTDAKKEIIQAAEHFSQIRASRCQQKTSSSSSLSSSSSSSSTGSPDDLTSGVIKRYSDDQQVTLGVRVPDNVVGLVVGPKGATIKRIQQNTDTYIITPGRDKDPVFEIIGLRQNAEAAKKEIESYIENRIGTGCGGYCGLDEGEGPPYGTTGTEAWVESVGVWTGVPSDPQKSEGNVRGEIFTPEIFTPEKYSIDSCGSESTVSNLRISAPPQNTGAKMVDMQYQEWAASTEGSSTSTFGGVTGGRGVERVVGGGSYDPMGEWDWRNYLNISSAITGTDMSTGLYGTKTEIGTEISNHYKNSMWSDGLNEGSASNDMLSFWRQGSQSFHDSINSQGNTRQNYPARDFPSTGIWSMLNNTEDQVEKLAYPRDQGGIVDEELRSAFQNSLIIQPKIEMPETGGVKGSSANKIKAESL